ncbi:MAG: TolC family protein [Tepidisphaerales bacterium]
MQKQLSSLTSCLRAFVPPCLLLAALVSSGCKVDQQAEVATYRQVVDKDAQAVDFTPGQALSLEQALALANQHNERLGLRGEDYLQALIAKDRAAAAFLPTVALVPSYYVQQSTHSVNWRDDHHVDVPVNASANLFNGFSDLARYRGSEHNIAMRRAILLDAQAAVLLDVANTYYQIISSEKLVEVLKNSLVVQEERVRDMRGRSKAGMARPLDLAQSEAQASQTRVLLLAAENDVRTGRTTLSFLAGVDAERNPLVDAVKAPPHLPELAQLQQTAAENRQDLVAAIAAIEAAKQGVQAAIGQYYPSVTLNLNGFISKQSYGSNSQWNSLLSANLPIFTGGSIHADVRTAWSLLRQAMLSESLTRRQVVEEVAIAFENIQSSRKRLDELKVQVAAAEEALRQADGAYKAGLGTNLERLTAQDQLLSAQLQITNQHFLLKQYHLQLLRAMGQLSTHLPTELTTQPATQPVTQPSTQPS